MFYLALDCFQLWKSRSTFNCVKNSFWFFSRNSFGSFSNKVSFKNSSRYSRILSKIYQRFNKEFLPSITWENSLTIHSEAIFQNRLFLKNIRSSSIFLFRKLSNQSRRQASLASIQIDDPRQLDIINLQKFVVINFFLLNLSVFKKLIPH